MTLDDRLTDVHQRSAKTLVRLQELHAQSQQIAATTNQANAELLRLDGEERLILTMKAEELPHA